MYTHIPNEMQWIDCGTDGLKDFGQPLLSGAWGIDNLNHAPDHVVPVWHHLALVRIPPDAPWRLERCTHLAKGVPIHPESVRDEMAWTDTLEWAHDFAQDLTSFVTMWVDTTHMWVYGMIGADILATRRWIHPMMQPDPDPIWDKAAHFDIPLLMSAWYSQPEPNMEDLL